MGGTDYGEMQPADIGATLALRNAVFVDDPPAPLTAADWAADGTVAAIAVRDGNVVGAIPMAPRRLVVAPGLVSGVAVENGVRADLRGQGVGSAMMAAACTFMRDRADALLVYPRHDRTPAYRFYARTGHHALLATPVYQWEHPAEGTLPPGSPLAGADAVFARAEQLLPLFQSAYRRFGGFPQRRAAYWRRALASSIFTEMPTDFFLVLVPDEDAPVGYAIAGINTRRPGNPVEILELAAPAADLAIAGHLIARVGAFAAARELAVEMAASERIRSYPRCSPPASRPARATGW